MSAKQGWGKIPATAEYPDSSPRTVRKYLKMGLPHVRLPSGTVLIKFSDVDQWLRRFQVNANRTDEIVSEVLKDFLEEK